MLTKVGFICGKCTAAVSENIRTQMLTESLVADRKYRGLLSWLVTNTFFFRMKGSLYASIQSATMHGSKI